MKLEENIDYELIPGEGENWDIRILTGDYVETVLNFKELTVSEDGEHLKFKVDIVATPDQTLNIDENVDLQQFAGMILSDILENSAVKANRGKSD